MAEAASGDDLDWVAIAMPLPDAGRTCVFEAGGRRLLLCNAEGTPYVLSDECPHVRVSLAGGALRGSILECPMHGGKLDVRDGSVVERPIRKAAVCFPVRATGDGLEVGIPRTSS